VSLLRQLIREELIKILREEVNKEVRNLIKEEMKEEAEEKRPIRKGRKKRKVRTVAEKEKIKSTIISFLKNAKEGVTTYEVRKALQEAGIDMSPDNVTGYLTVLVKEGVVEKRRLNKEEAEKLGDRIQRIPFQGVNLWFLKRDVQIPFEEQEKLLNQRGRWTHFNT